jgi:hypothetical protein
MCIEPIELWLDRNALRRGMIAPVHPETDPTALLIQDSGMVPVSTQICIVNPETNCLCHVGEYGEIWVQSEANVDGFYGSKDVFDKERFQGRTVDGDPNVKYMRTGDLGFLHTVSRPIGAGGSPIEMQCLFVLGSIGETFEVNGLLHFPMDIEESVERCHRNIVPGGCAVFQAGGLVVVLVEIFRKNFLASIVPVIVNSILNHHHLIVDIVAFVAKGDFPRSRLGEKQRGKILAGWVTRKMMTIAQFCIREEEDEGKIGQIAEEGQLAPKSSVGSRPSNQGLRPGSTVSMTSSAAPGRMSSQNPGGQQAYAPDRSSSNLLTLSQSAQGPEYYQPSGLQPGRDLERPSSSNHVELPSSSNHIELPSNSNHIELPAPLDIPELPSGSFTSNDHEITPTNSARPMYYGGGPTSAPVDDEYLRHPQLGLVTSLTQNSDPLHYSPIDQRNNPFADSPTSHGRGSMERSPVDYEGLAYNEARGSFDDIPPVRQSAAAVAASALVRDPRTGATAGQLDPMHRTTTPGYAISKKPYMQVVNRDVPATTITTTNTSMRQESKWYGPPPCVSTSPIQDPVNRTTTPSSGARNLLPSQMRRNSQQLLSRSQTDLTYMGSNGPPPPLPPKISPEEDEEQWRRDALGYLGYAGVGPGHYGR